MGKLQRRNKEENLPYNVKCCTYENVGQMKLGATVAL